MFQIRFIPFMHNAKRPTQATAASAGWDLYAADVAMDYDSHQLIVNTGLQVSFDPGHVMLIFARSGLATKQGIRLANGVGVVDADYRGPLKVFLRSDQLTDYQLQQAIRPGDRIAQAVLLPIPLAEWIETDKLDETERGEGGFGSTGSN
jgi:dUTP pyrophosphatase